MYRIIGIVDGHYIVKTHEGLKKVKIDMENKNKISNEYKNLKSAQDKGVSLSDSLDVTTFFTYCKFAG